MWQTADYQPRQKVLNLGLSQILPKYLRRQSGYQTNLLSVGFVLSSVILYKGFRVIILDATLDLRGIFFLGGGGINDTRARCFVLFCS